MGIIYKKAVVPVMWWNSEQYKIWEPSAFVIHRLYSLGSLKLYMARHQQEKSSRFSVLFDEYPDLYDTATIFPLFFCKNTFLSLNFQII